MKKILLGSAFIILLLPACSGFKTDNGMQYEIYHDESGPVIKDGDMAAISTIEQTETGVKLYSSYDYDDRPMITFKSTPLFKGDFNTALGLLSQGDSATFKIRVDSLIRVGQKPAGTKGQYILYTVKVNRVVPRGKQTDSAYTAKYEALRNELAEKERPREAAKIRQYIAANGIKPTVTASGLRYIIMQQGHGAKPVIGDSLYVNYTGMFLSGQPYITTSPQIAKKAGMDHYDVLHIKAGSGIAFPGLDEALLLFNRGTKVKLIIPSKIGYGAYAHQGIEPYTPLLFDIEVLGK